MATSNPSLLSSAGPADWIPIGRACVMLGVNPATLRQWTKMGRVQVYRTPGGHRRYSAAELESLRGGAERDSAPPLVDAVLTDLRSKYRGFAHSTTVHQGWLGRIDSGARVRFHALGDQLLGALASYLSDVGPRFRQRALADARRIASQYGALARELGASPSEAVEAYLLFRRPLLDVLARFLATRRDPPEQLSRIMRDAERFMDNVLAAIAEAGDGGHQVPDTSRVAAIGDGAA